MTVIYLPKWLEPAGTFDLMRLGRACDGGYLVDSRDVAAADVLIALGVNDDWSFEEDFLQHQEVPLHAFDGTISRRILAERLIKGVALWRDDINNKFRAWRDYGKFFAGSRHHHAKMVGFRDAPGFLTLQQITEEYAPNGQNGKIFLKIDIEGWEYRLLNDLLAASDRICGIAIEFHDVDLHYERLEEFVKKLPLSVAHVHHNSFGLTSDQGMPLVVEVTFTSHAPVTSDRPELPHALDRPSSPDHEQCEIRFAD